MKRPSGEMVDLDFYFDDRVCADALRDVVNHCLTTGATFSGEMLVYEFDGARLAKLRHRYSHESRMAILSDEEMRHQMEREDVRIHTIGLWNVLGLSDTSPEIVSFNGVSEEATRCDTNPISIVGEGWRFSTEGYESERRQDGLKCYSRFIGVCKSLLPAYAAIMNEDSLPCLYDLSRKNDPRYFRTFFVSTRFAGKAILDQIVSMYGDSYVERSPEGIYVSTWGYAPIEVNVDVPSALRRSKQVAQLLCSRAARREV